ncbi:ankyrin, putative [Acanthamoeba castellanii str. Neff]|uniref:Ankyrin, putative n=1 Tax=Acanthamoeba castellanii (strain ATCC 30010 / Neff) TaxID=1257118 RepID=L8GXP4_ACACF|nr:ankyrin, putative [Acanthamoeba castellanii str. Neff]ELR18024.1 ankyrin, putative [Acanthamoeba castellanii str. Neff]
METLPYELQLALLERVPLVCQAWRHLAADSHLWRAHHRTLFLGGGATVVDHRAKCAPAVRWLAHHGPRSTVGQRMQWACEQGIAGVVSALHFIMPKLTERRPNHFMAAVVAGHTNVVACFLDFPADENGGAWWERCPINLQFARMACDLAAWNGHTEIVVLLLDSLPKHLGKGACDHSVLLLTTAISAGHVDTVRAVVSHPSYDQVPDYLLGHAVSSRSELIVGVLLLSGKLRPADAKNDETLVELFLRFGVSVNALMRLPSWTLTPLCQAGTRRMVKLLLAKGADPNSHCPLGYAIKWSRMSAAEALLRGGAEVNAIDGQGLTLLSHAAKRGSGKLVELLLRHGADAGLANSDGTTPLSLVRRELAQYADSAWDDWDIYTFGNRGGLEDVEQQLVRAGAIS